MNDTATDYHGPALWIGRCITCQRMIQRGEPVIAGSRADAILGIHFHPWCFTGWF